MGLIGQMKLKKIKDNGDKVELIFNAYVGCSNIPEETPIIVTKEQLKELINLVH